MPPASQGGVLENNPKKQHRFLQYWKVQSDPLDCFGPSGPARPALNFQRSDDSPGVNYFSSSNEKGYCDSMLASELVEIICAAHLSSYVDSPFQERGGIMFIGGPAALKSTFVSVLDTQYHDVVMYSDLNVKTLTQVRDQMATGAIRTLVLPELAKLYERNPSTASNVEGTIRALAAEGFTAASFEDARVNRLKARAVVIGALTPSTQQFHFDQWEATGFNRRFLWPLIRLANSSALTDAVVEWKLIDFRVTHVPRAPLGNEKIPNVTSRQERSNLLRLVKYQPGTDHALQLQLMVKMMSVLRWWYNETGDPRDPMHTMEAFGKALGREGAQVELIPVTHANAAKEASIMAQQAGKQLANRRWRKSGKKKKKVGRK